MIRATSWIISDDELSTPRSGADQNDAAQTERARMGRSAGIIARARARARDDRARVARWSGGGTTPFAGRSFSSGLQRQRPRGVHWIRLSVRCRLRDRAIDRL